MAAPARPAATEKPAEAPLALGYGTRSGEEILADLDPFFQVGHLLRAGAVALAYASVIFLAFIGLAHVARSFAGIDG